MAALYTAVLTPECLDGDATAESCDPGTGGYISTATTLITVVLVSVTLPFYVHDKQIRSII